MDEAGVSTTDRFAARRAIQRSARQADRPRKLNLNRSPVWRPDSAPEWRVEDRVFAFGNRTPALAIGGDAEDSLAMRTAEPEVLPGILENDWSGIERKIEIVKPFARAIHIDILDGKFAPNTTFLDPKPFTKYSSDIFFELHMMVEEPIDYVERFAAVNFRRFVGHVEKMSDQNEFLARVRRQGGEAGLAVDGPTSVEAVAVPVRDVDCFLVMTITAGFSGQQFVAQHLEKVKTLRRQTAVPIEVDGGVRDSTALLARDAGASRFVTTSYLFGCADPAAQYRSLDACLRASSH
jgi:ribulose-phosphate 3-epimerase